MPVIRVYKNYEQGSYSSYTSLGNLVSCNRGDYLGFGYDLSGDGSSTYNDIQYNCLRLQGRGIEKYNSSTGSYESVNATSIRIDDVSASSMKLYIRIYLKDHDDNYYEILYDWATPFSSCSFMSKDDYEKYCSSDLESTGYPDYYSFTKYIYYTTEYGWHWITGSRGFRVPDYVEYGRTTLYVDVWFEVDCDMVVDGTATKGTYKIPINNKSQLDKLSSDFTLNSDSKISYPTFCTSSNARVSANKVINSTSVVLYRSIDNGVSWTQVYSKQNSTNNAIDETHQWTIKCWDENGDNGKDRTFNLYAIPPITLSYHDTDAINQTLTTTHGIKYKAVYTALGSNGTSNATTLEVAPSTEMQVMDLTLPDTITFSEKADYFKSTGQTYSIKKTTVSDTTRIKFRHLFKHTSLPNTTVPGSSTDLQDYPDRETNMGQWLTTPNGTYEYQIVPILDGSECYTSSIGQKYEKINFVKAGHKLEAIRPIEMGSNKPIKIKLLTTPSKTEFPSGASVKFYVANNGNDSNIAWEELPNSCIGTPSNPNVDQFQFSNTTKTADTWKVMIKIVADKNTATTDFKLNNFTVIINGGEKDTSVPGYKYIANTILTENATSVRIDIPQGYKKIRIEGYMTPTGETNTGYNITVNGITSYTDNKMRTVLLQGSSPWTNSANSTVFLNIPIGGGAYNHLTLDLFNDGIRWIGSLLSIGDKGLGASHNRIKLTDGLSYITLSCAASGYMAKNTEITIMGVD